MNTKLTPFDRTIIYGCLVFLAVGISLLAGCHNAELNFYRSLAVTSQAVAAAHSSLDKYDDGKISTILAIPDHDKARAELAAYEKSLTIARQVLHTTEDALDVTNGANQLYQDAKAKNWTKALSDLIGVAMPVVDALGQFGIKVPL